VSKCIGNSGYRYYFNPDEGVCGRFWYRGCGGNSNHFHALVECNQLCAVKNEQMMRVQTVQPVDPAGLCGWRATHLGM
jgi:hypothetical protein